jgi:homogentisate 1,2-dioxygenase
MEAALSDEKMKFAVMLNNNFRIKKALHDDGAITDTALLYNDNVFELPLAKQTKERNSNKQLAFRNLRSVFIMRRTYS